MMQILAFVPGVLFGILASLYGTVARIYDIMLSLTGYYKDGGFPDNYIITTSNVMTTMYTLAGIFMLFKVTISMINMLIEPDQINDRQAGTGKMITRIVTSLLMLMLFVPNGWIFNKDPNNPGILMRIEKALLAEDGLIHNMMPEINGEKANLSSDNKKDTLLVDNVYAVPADEGTSGRTGYDCFYVYITRSNAHQAQKSNAGVSDVTPNSEKSITHVMHLTFYGDRDTGLGGEICPGDGKLINCNYSYTAHSLSPYDTIKGKLTWEKVKEGWPAQHNCPNRINTGEMKAYDGYGNGASTWSDVTSQYVGGWHSLSAMQEDVQASGLPAASKNASKIAKLLGIDAENSYLYGVSEEASDFAQGALSSFLQCTGSDEECDSLKTSALSTNEGNKMISEALNEDNPSITLDFMIGVVAGIGLVVWIALLCVDVIIRRFKLILLEMMAPIPIIAYSDPKDETFNKWLKMYGSTYADLFIKLIAISFAILLLQQMDAAMEDTGLLRFFYIIAILIFAKLIPDMISNIFGIKLGSGSFGQIKDMYKKAFGLGAGAIAGGAVGLGTGIRAAAANRMDSNKLKKLKEKAAKGDEQAQKDLADYKSKWLDRRLSAAGAVTSGVAGFFRGASSGANGKILAGAKDIAAVNENRRAKYQAGLSPTDLIAAATVGKVGLDYASHVDREIAPLLERKEVADGVPKVLDVPLAAYKKSGFAMTLDSLLNQRQITGNQHKQLTKDYLDWQSTLLGDAYGEVKDDKLTGQLDLSKLQSDVAAGTITADRAMDIVMNDAKFQAAMHGAMAEGQQKKDYMKLHISLLGEAYGEVGSNGELTGKLDESKLLQAVNAGTITEQEANDILIKDAEFQAAINGRSGLNPDLAGDVKVEVGIQNTLATALDTLNAKAKGSGYFADAIGNPANDIVDYNGIDAAINASYSKSKVLSEEINAKTVADPNYMASKAANQAAGNDKK